MIFPVGSKGRVLSMDIREDHLKRAAINYNDWRRSWNLRRGEEWPDNVQFHNADLRTASLLLAGWGFHAVSGRSLNYSTIHQHLIMSVKTGGMTFCDTRSFIGWIMSIAGCSWPDQPSPGFTHCDSTSAPWSCVCCLYPQVCISCISLLPFKQN